jgi:hypothetical protein
LFGEAHLRVADVVVVLRLHFFEVLEEVVGPRRLVARLGGDGRRADDERGRDENCDAETDEDRYHTISWSSHYLAIWARGSQFGGRRTAARGDASHPANRPV